MSGFQQARVHLGTQLRQLRETAQLSGKDLAARLGWQASKVSRIENARQSASEEDVVVWAQAVDAPSEVMDELIAQAITLVERQDSWRQRHKSGLAALQEEVRELESRTRLLRVFEPGLIIGLLQTAEYARHIFAKVRRVQGSSDDIDAAIRVRMRRQEILYDPARRFHFLMPEAVLRYRLAPDEVMRGQLDRLLAVTTLPNVEFGLIPFEAELPSALLNGFWLYDETLVGVATRTKELVLRDPDEITFHAAAFEELRAVAAFQEQARELIVRVLVEYSKQSEP
ncbi:helix-turn-helix domain-containing protein [Sphaerisporangium aureirubrum]|uniref:Helix-turn-helix domain-containing protein n=1 Tax=Sphaerisporangium aureirubrum TaxID=1544736 RepID=A0ABW1NM81_9ACTN